jgi:hypothetical protein
VTDPLADILNGDDGVIPPEERGHLPGDAAGPDRNGVPQRIRTEDRPAGWMFRPMDSATFDAGDFRREWLARLALVRAMPGIIGGPSKALKTSVSVDLAISLGTGTSFLDYFSVPKPVRVAFLSGESGEAALQETARRVCAARGVRLADADVLWQTDLPSFCDATDVAELADGLGRCKVGVVILDPLYLMLLAGAGSNGPRAENVMEVGPLLRRVGSACVAAGVTPILNHHTRKAVGREPLELSELAYAGVSEYARQWLLINRRERYDGTGTHRLWLSVGGSAGHGGDWGLDIQEGTPDADFAGRTWQVSLTPRREMRDDEQEARQTRRAAELQGDEQTVMTTIDRLAADGPATLTRIRDGSGLSRTRTDRSLERLRLARLVEEHRAQVMIGSGAKRGAAAYRRIDT